MARRKRSPAPPPATRQRLFEAVIGSVDGAPVLFGPVLWAELWTSSAIGQMGGVLGIPPGKVLRVEAWVVDESEEAARVAVARRGPGTGEDFDVMHFNAERRPKGVGHA
jgi:hypothetical protein